MENPSLLKNKRGRENFNNKNRKPIPLVDETTNKKKDITLLFQERKDISKSYLKKYIKNKELNDLLDALYYDNTNPVILYYYLKYLKDNNPNEFEKQFPYRNFFLTIKEMSKLAPNHPFSKNTPKQIFESLVQKALPDSNKVTEQWKKKILSFVNENSLKAPYLLKRVNNNENTYYYNKTEDKITFEEPIEQTFPFSLQDDSSCYKYSLLLLNEYLNRSEDEYICNAVLFVLKELVKGNSTPTKIAEYVNRITLSLEGDELVCLLKEILKENNINVELKGFDEVKEENSQTNNRTSLFYTTQLAKPDSNYKTKIIEDNKYFGDGKNEIHKFLKQIMKQLIHTTCIKSILQDLFPNQMEHLDIFDEKFIDYAFQDIQFIGMYNHEDYGSTDLITNRVAINIERKRRIIDLNSINENYVFYFPIWIITVIHEIIGHFARKYLYYVIESNKEFHTDRDKQIEDDGGKYIEHLLFGVGKDQYIILNMEKIEFIMKMSNWEQHYSTFSNKFSSLNNSSSLSEIMERIKNNQIMKELFAFVNFSDKEIKQLIKEKILFGFSLKSKMSPIIIINISEKNNKRPWIVV